MCIELYVNKVLVFSQCEDVINVSNVTDLNHTSPVNRTNTTLSNYSSQLNSTLLNGTYNTTTSIHNMTVAFTIPNSTPNITTNSTLPLREPFDERAYETTAEIVMKIVIPLVVLGVIWISIYFCRKKKKTKVQCVKMIDNPYFGADVETPENTDKREHKDPDVKTSIEHKDPDVKTNIEHEDDVKNSKEQKPTKLMTI